ncbi:MAG: CFI-box-CTERM domain-containing protein [Nitrosopumilaceae archaeon]
MNKFFVLVVFLVGPLLIQMTSAQTEPQEEAGPQPFDFKIGTDKAFYHYTYDQDTHETIRIFVNLPQLIPNEKVVVKSLYTRGPHSFTDVYPICSDTTVTNCFSKLEDEVYFVDSERQYGTLFGQWVLDATYADKRAATYFEITPLTTFELDATKEKYTVKELQNEGLHLVFLGTQVSNQTTLKLELFKMVDDDQARVFNYNVNIEMVGEPPYFNRLPITFTKEVPFNTGKYNITATWENLFDSDTFEIVESVIEINQSNKETIDTIIKPKSGCLIATAAFGSELAPQVQLLREFRDSYILSTRSGASFLQVFNLLYYSFSPAISDAERQNPALQTIIKGSLYPLIMILQVSQAATFGGEIGTILAGFVASTLIGAAYLWPLSLRFDFTRAYKKLILVIVASTGFVVLGIFSSNTPILMISTTVFVLTSLVFGVTLTSKTRSLFRTKNKKGSN